MTDKRREKKSMTYVEVTQENRSQPGRDETGCPAKVGGSTRSKKWHLHFSVNGMSVKLLWSHEDREQSLPALREKDIFHFKAFGQQCTLTHKGIILRQ